jgi:hypothetical protein
VLYPQQAAPYEGLVDICLWSQGRGSTRSGHWVLAGASDFLEEEPCSAGLGISHIGCLGVRVDLTPGGGPLVGPETLHGQRFTGQPSSHAQASLALGPGNHTA